MRCSSANNMLQCLREAPLGDAAVDKTPTISSPQSLAISWFPRADGVFLKDDDEVLLSQGKAMSKMKRCLMSDASDVDSTDAELVDYITGNYPHGVTRADVDKLLE
ncbi:hypothetical protein A0H81_14553 [Grifola frondosa]|uniref:Uncharacterized protein n=1 Tax=Grifola frondosa TaxID=5627 RepID=A0A1C7LN30_GRIFR|nr:hypothetical protein A0H81_14553 [Grifola frondosa]